MAKEQKVRPSPAMMASTSALRPRPGKLAPDDMCDSCGGQAQRRVQLLSQGVLDFCWPCWDAQERNLKRVGASVLQ